MRGTKINEKKRKKYYSEKIIKKREGGSKHYRGSGGRSVASGRVREIGDGGGYNESLTVMFKRSTDRNYGEGQPLMRFCSDRGQLVPNSMLLKTREMFKNMHSIGKAR